MKKTLKSLLAVLFCVLMLSATVTSASAAAGPTVRVKAVATNAVTIYWTKVNLATGYEIQRTTNGKTWVNLRAGTAAVKATEYTDAASLVTGVNYGYRVRAKFLVGYSDWSAMVVGKPIPAQVTGLKVTAATANAVRLTWNKVAGATGYLIQNYSGGWKNLKVLTANQFVVTGLKLGVNYNYRVFAYKTVNGKAVYGPASAFITTSPVLIAPTTVKLTGITANALRIAWNAVAGATGYEIFNHTTGVWTNAGNRNVIILSGFKPAETCSFTVRAYSGTFKGKESAAVTFKTAPSAPTNMVIKEATYNSVKFSWDPVSGATGYMPAYYDYAKKVWTNLPATTGVSATVTGLAANTQYAFSVRAYVANANVLNISAYAFSGYTLPVVNAKTVLPAMRVAALVSPNNTDTSIRWLAVNGATGYCVEKYNINLKEWLRYDFSRNDWYTPETLPSDANVSTTALTFTDSGVATRADVYRVRAINTTGELGTPSVSVTAFTNDVWLNNTAAVYTILQVLRWPAYPNAVSYSIKEKSHSAYEDDVCQIASSVASSIGGGKCQATLYLAPNTTHAVKVYANLSDGTTVAATNWITFTIGEVPAAYFATNHAYYNHAVNSQLLYVAQAINNTKNYREPITVRNITNVNYKVMYLKMPIIPDALLDTPEEVEAFFKKNDPDGELTTNSSEKFDATYTFTNGRYIGENNRPVNLKSFIEPSSNDNQLAYLHNSQLPLEWKKGFDSVAIVKNKDGSSVIRLNFKQEKNATNYHNGYMSSFSSADFGASSGLSVKDLLVGKSVLTVIIDKDGYLTAYAASSPYSAAFVANFTLDEDVNEDGFNASAGSLISMEMGIAGSTVFNYTFAR